MNKLLSFFLLAFTFPVLLIIGVIIKLESNGPVLHWSKRVGENGTFFLMPKFRTMFINTPQMATHLLETENYITKTGRVLRKTSLDELPQLLSILKGDMNFIGPRPALFNQDDLISLREGCGVNMLKPGVTGWAQVNGRDEIEIPLKVSLDKFYLNNRSFSLNLKIIFLTFLKVLLRRDISH